MQTQHQEQAQVLPIPATIGAELQAGGPKVSEKEKGKKGAVSSVKGGLNLANLAKDMAEALEGKRMTAVNAYLVGAKAIKEPANIEDARKVLLETLQKRQFPGANARASEFAAVAFAWHFDRKGTEEAVSKMVPKLKDGKPVKDANGNEMMFKPSETDIMRRVRVIRSRIPEGEPGFTKKGNRETKGGKLNATQFGRMLDYLKLMDASQWEKYQEAYEGEAAIRRSAQKKTKK
jgi:hypothetical protein